MSQMWKIESISFEILNQERCMKSIGLAGIYSLLFKCAFLMEIYFLFGIHRRRFVALAHQKPNGSFILLIFPQCKYRIFFYTFLV